MPTITASSCVHTIIDQKLEGGRFDRFGCLFYIVNARFPWLDKKYGTTVAMMSTSIYDYFGSFCY
jgi:hypothetical protein